eukprot:g4235.t1
MTAIDPIYGYLQISFGVAWLILFLACVLQIKWRIEGKLRRVGKQQKYGVPTNTVAILLGCLRMVDPWGFLGIYTWQVIALMQQFTSTLGIALVLFTSRNLADNGYFLLSRKTPLWLTYAQYIWMVVACASMVVSAVVDVIVNNSLSSSFVYLSVGLALVVTAIQVSIMSGFMYVMLGDYAKKVQETARAGALVNLNALAYHRANIKLRIWPAVALGFGSGVWVFFLAVDDIGQHSDLSSFETINTKSSYFSPTLIAQPSVQLICLGFMTAYMWQKIPKGRSANSQASEVSTNLSHKHAPKKAAKRINLRRGAYSPMSFPDLMGDGWRISMGLSSKRKKTNLPEQNANGQSAMAPVAENGEPVPFNANTQQQDGGKENKENGLLNCHDRKQLATDSLAPPTPISANGQSKNPRTPSRLFGLIPASSKGDTDTLEGSGNLGKSKKKRKKRKGKKGSRMSAVSNAPPGTDHEGTVILMSQATKLDTLDESFALYHKDKYYGQESSSDEESDSTADEMEEKLEKMKQHKDGGESSEEELEDLPQDPELHTDHKGGLQVTFSADGTESRISRPHISMERRTASTNNPELSRYLSSIAGQPRQASLMLPGPDAPQQSFIEGRETYLETPMAGGIGPPEVSPHHHTHSSLSSFPDYMGKSQVQTDLEGTTVSNSHSSHSPKSSGLSPKSPKSSVSHFSQSLAVPSFAFPSHSPPTAAGIPRNMPRTSVSLPRGSMLVPSNEAIMIPEDGIAILPTHYDPDNRNSAMLAAIARANAMGADTDVGQEEDDNDDNDDDEQEKGKEKEGGKAAEEKKKEPNMFTDPAKFAIFTTYAKHPKDEDSTTHTVDYGGLVSESVPTHLSPRTRPSTSKKKKKKKKKKHRAEFEPEDERESFVVLNNSSKNLLPGLDRSQQNTLLTSINASDSDEDEMRDQIGLIIGPEADDMGRGHVMTPRSLKRASDALLSQHAPPPSVKAFTTDPPAPSSSPAGAPRDSEHRRNSSIPAAPSGNVTPKEEEPGAQIPPFAEAPSSAPASPTSADKTLEIA